MIRDRDLLIEVIHFTLPPYYEAYEKFRLLSILYTLFLHIFVSTQASKSISQSIMCGRAHSFSLNISDPHFFFCKKIGTSVKSKPHS